MLFRYTDYFYSYWYGSVRCMYNENIGSFYITLVCEIHIPAFKSLPRIPLCVHAWLGTSTIVYNAIFLGIDNVVAMLSNLLDNGGIN